MRNIAIMLTLLTLACCTEAVVAQQPPDVKNITVKNTAVNISTTQKPNLYGLPIIITFPDLPAVPDKIKAPKPSKEAGAALRNIPAFTPATTSDGPDAAKSR